MPYYVDTARSCCTGCLASYSIAEFGELVLATGDEIAAEWPEETPDYLLIEPGDSLLGPDLMRAQDERRDTYHKARAAALRPEYTQRLCTCGGLVAMNEWAEPTDSWLPEAVFRRLWPDSARPAFYVWPPGAPWYKRALWKLTGKRP